MGIRAEICGYDICTAIAILYRWKDWAHIEQDTLDYLRGIATQAIGKGAVDYELRRQGVKVE